MAKGDYDTAHCRWSKNYWLRYPLTRVDVPEVLRWKGIALIGLNQLDEALQVLTEACSLAKETNS